LEYRTTEKVYYLIPLLNFWSLTNQPRIE
jgi:hypothetical protein